MCIRDRSRKDHFKNFRRKSRKFQNGEGEASRTQEKPVQNAGSEQAAAGDRKPQEKKTFEKKAFEKKPYEKKPFEKKRDRKKPARQDAEAKPRQQDWDDDNFGIRSTTSPSARISAGCPATSRSTGSRRIPTIRPPRPSACLRSCPTKTAAAATSTAM
mgnify:CR=1 FL=1